MPAAVEVHQVWSLPATDTLAGRQALWWSAGPDGELAVLLVHRRHLRHISYVKGWIGWRPEAPFDGVLVTTTAGQEPQRRPVNDIRADPSHMALLPGSRLLMVSGRTRPEKGIWKPNAVVYSAEGKQDGSAFCVGDDIQVLVTDRSGGIWTAYGDEGIYGSHPESAAGLAGWDTESRTAMWAPTGLPDLPLEGCTGATDREHVWLVWYSGTRTGGTFLTRITPATGEVTSWPSPVSNPDGFAVHGNRAVLTARHHNQRSVELTHAELDNSTWTVTSRRTLQVPGRVVKRCGQGRDGFLWLRAGDTWLRIKA